MSQIKSGTKEWWLNVAKHEENGPASSFVGEKPKMSKMLFAFTACNGDLEKLKQLKVQGCPRDWTACSQAAGAGRLGILQWLRENNCPWNENVCSSAARGGRLEVLQWARENGCPWDFQLCCFEGAKEGNIDILDWIVKESPRN